MDHAGREPLQTLRQGGKPAMAAALARLERAPFGAATLALLDAAYAAPKAQVIGLTGPPGVGKSTLLGRLVEALRAQGTVGVIAVDPSSQRSGGALLGDRLRIASDPRDAGVFVRSMAARDRLGGLADVTMAATVLMRAVYDRVLIETVGVGQSEADVAAIADSVLFCVQPASGDALQFMKAGIMEIPHVVAITKADLGAAATRALADLKGALSLAAEGADRWTVPVAAVSARDGAGLDALLAGLADHWRHLGTSDRLETTRRRQAGQWIALQVRDQFGRHGLRQAGSLALAAGEPPFQRLSEVLTALRRRHGA